MTPWDLLGNIGEGLALAVRDFEIDRRESDRGDRLGGSPMPAIETRLIRFQGLAAYSKAKAALELPT